jgi:iron complex outermembrane receptor protein
VGKGPFTGLLNPVSSQDNIFSGFVQDQISLLPVLKLTLGTKVEHNDFSGMEVQPSGRFAVGPVLGQTLWGAISRAVRVPTRLERDIDLTVPFPQQAALVHLTGNPDFHAEVMVAYELGYRIQAGQRVYFDLAGYYNVYHGLASLEPMQATLTQSGAPVVPLTTENLTDGIAKGAELSVTVLPLRGWKLVGNYTNTVVTLTPHGFDLEHEVLGAGATPRNQFGVHSFLQLRRPRTTTWTSACRGVAFPTLSLPWLVEACSSRTTVNSPAARRYRARSIFRSLVATRRLC